MKEETERLKLEAKRRRIATELHVVADLKRSYVEPSWRKNNRPL